MTVSWRPEVIADDFGQFVGNGLRFATEQEAIDNAHDLEMRWTAVRYTRAVPSDDPVNYSYHDGKLTPIKE
jgi:hypothetical protein